MAELTTDPVRLPPAPRIPKLLQGVGFVAAREKSVAALAKRYGPAFTLNLPIFGPTVVIGDPALIKELFTAKSDMIVRAGVLGEIFGPGSTFSLHGAEHRERRKLLVPPFHGKRMVGYEEIVEEEVMREIESWPEGKEFETMPSMMRITLNAILRTVFGAEGTALDELRDILPGMVLYASRLAVMPPVVRRDFGSEARAGSWRTIAGVTTRPSPASSPISVVTGALRSATTCCRSCCRHATRTARRYPTTMWPMNCSRCWQRDMRRPPPRWRGRSSDCAGTRGCCPSWPPRWTRVKPTSSKPPSGRFSGPDPSSTARRG